MRPLESGGARVEMRRVCGQGIQVLTVHKLWFKACHCRSTTAMGIHNIHDGHPVFLLIDNIATNLLFNNLDVFTQEKEVKHTPSLYCFPPTKT